MANFDLLMRSLAFIEEHLEDSIQTEEIAQACFASKSALEKVFKYTIHFSVHDYMIRRRMTKAARIMLEKPDFSLLDIAWSPCCQCIGIIVPILSLSYITFGVVFGGLL